MNVTTRLRRTRRWAIAPIAVALALLTSSCLAGPIAGTPTLGGLIDVAKVGYQQSEFFVGGWATAYKPTAPFGTDGAWQAAPDPANAGAYFKTRAVVERPVDPAAFNGTVVIEWLNVSAGADLPSDWVMTHNEFVRTGTVWIGVSAQSVGVNQLKSCCAARYDSLVHPGDSFSYDIFNTAAREVLNNPSFLGGLTPQRLIATGESQSAGRLVTYIDAVHPLVHLFDGFMVHSRGAGGAPLSQAPLATVGAPSPSLIRTDLAEPVFVVQAEGDVIGSNLAVRQPDTATFRSWELAGTAHADTYLTGVGFGDIGDGAGATKMFDQMRNPFPPSGGCSASINAGPHHWQLQAAFHALDRWVRSGTLPPIGPLLQVASTSPTVLARDVWGNALGGVRSPHVDVRVATLTGLNSGPGFCRLFGSTVALTPAQLAVLYPTHADFVSKWSAALATAEAGGFILPSDAFELRAAAIGSTVPN